VTLVTSFGSHVYIWAPMITLTLALKLDPKPNINPKPGPTYY